MKTALVLSGGGARGAYEAGVVSYLRDELGPKLGKPVALDILCGTSVGAITACMLASTANRPAQQGGALRELWSRLKLEEVLKLGAKDLARSFWERGGGGLFNPAGLRRVLLDHLEWPAIGRNLRSGALQALSVSATRVSDGRACLFVQQRPPPAPLRIHNLNLEVIATRIGPRHALASAAMPLLFAPVRIGGQLHVDGGLRLNVPLSPAVRLGAQRVIVVSMQPTQPYAFSAPDEPLRVSAAFLTGKALNALIQDRTEQDVEHFERLNAIVEGGCGAFGPQFTPALDGLLAARGQQPLRYVRSLVLRPSRDIGVVAGRIAQSRAFCRRNRRLSQALVGLLARREPEGSADLASYLLFDAAFAEELISLGQADARSREKEWVRFFDDQPLNEAEAAQAPRYARQPSAVVRRA